MMETAPVGLLSFDELGQCIDCNEAVAKIIGASCEQILQQNYNMVPSWEKSGMRKMALEVMRTGIEAQGDFHIVSTFGREFWLAPDDIVCMLGKPYKFDQLRDVLKSVVGNS